jgi:hypothetical protein
LNLGDGAFSESPLLRSIWLPASLTNIPRSCFHHCPNGMAVVLEAGSRLSQESLTGLQRRWTVTIAHRTNLR